MVDVVARVVVSVGVGVVVRGVVRVVSVARVVRVC